MIVDKSTPHSKKGMRVFSNYLHEEMPRHDEGKNLAKSQIFAYTDQYQPRSPHNDEIYLESSFDFNKQVHENKLNRVGVSHSNLLSSKHGAYRNDIPESAKISRNHNGFVKRELHTAKTERNSSVIFQQNSNPEENKSALQLLNSITFKIAQPQITVEKPRYESIYDSEEYQKLLKRNSELTEKINSIFSQKSQLFNENSNLSYQNSSLKIQIQSMQLDASFNKKIHTQLEEKYAKLQKELRSVHIDVYKATSEADFYKNKFYEEFQRNQELIKQVKQAEYKTAQLNRLKQIIWKNSQNKTIGSDIDSRQVVEDHLKYQALISELQEKLRAEVSLREQQVNSFRRKQEMINREIQVLVEEIEKKMKNLIKQKQKLESELEESRNQIEKIRKSIWIDFSTLLDEQQNKIITLKEQNMYLELNSGNKLEFIKVQSELQIYKKKNEELMIRNKELQEACERLKNYAMECQKNYSQYEAETTVKTSSVCGFEGFPSGQFERMIKNYETRISDFVQHTYQKSKKQEELKKKIDDLRMQLEEAKNEANLAKRTNKSSEENKKSCLEALKLELKSETQSLNRKIDRLEKAISRKSTQIKEKDQFIVKYLLQRIKNQRATQQIVQQIQSYFSCEGEVELIRIN